ncbi:MAG TPA: hypothetical protein VFA41_12495 [Ktedonobacteraceae bacterium]|jgi:hypothetical protein|nr:hypothetical protein [Ktedonobacteraceae bacterium]
MIGNGKRRFYRFSLASTICFLCALALYDVQALASQDAIIPAVDVFMIFGVGLFLKGFESLCYQDEYDRFEQVYPCEHYARLFYGVGFSVLFTTGFLLLWTMIMGAANLQEQGVLGFGLLVVGGCLAIGRSSQSV